jgi:integrase
VDFGSLTVRIQRSIVAGDVNATKNEASEGTLPLDPDLAEALLQHKARAAYKSDSDYVFAGRTGKPSWKDWILADRLKPVAKRAKIGGVGFGWHTFRHSYRNWLKRFNTPLKTQRQLM